MDNTKINEAALTKRIKTLVLQGRYQDAQRELEEIEVSKLKSSSLLCLVGEVYMGLQDYEEAERVLLRVYEKNPTARRILDLLTTLYIEKGEYSEAEYYYKEFISVASKDLHRYILRYRIDKGKNERLSVLIHTLEKLKEYEYIEEWAYELAALYDASGQKKKCLHECEEIVLWFGHGEYVDKAIALRCKLTGEPLPEMTTVEMYRAEEERREREEREKEAVYAEISRRSAGPVVDGMEDVFDGSIDTEMIQQTLEGRQNQAAKERETAAAAKTEAAVPTPAKLDTAAQEGTGANGTGEDAPEGSAGAQEAAERTGQEETNAGERPAEEISADAGEAEELAEEKPDAAARFDTARTRIASDLKKALSRGGLFKGSEPQEVLDQEETPEKQTHKVESAEEEEGDEIIPESVITDAEKNEKESITQVFANLMSGKLLSRIRPGKEEPAAEADKPQTAPETLNNPDQKPEGEPEREEAPAEEAAALDLSIFEMKADQAFEDSIIQNMEEAMRAGFGEEEGPEKGEETVEEIAETEEKAEETPVSEAIDRPAEAESFEKAAQAVEAEIAETTDQAAEAEIAETTDQEAEAERSDAADQAVEGERSDPADQAAEDKMPETLPQNAAEAAAVFAEEIAEAVGDPSAFISEQTERFEPETESVSEESAETAEESAPKETAETAEEFIPEEAAEEPEEQASEEDIAKEPITEAPASEEMAEVKEEPVTEEFAEAGEEPVPEEPEEVLAEEEKTASDAVMETIEEKVSETITAETIPEEEDAEDDEEDEFSDVFHAEGEIDLLTRLFAEPGPAEELLSDHAEGGEEENEILPESGDEEEDEILPESDDEEEDEILPQSEDDEDEIITGEPGDGFVDVLFAAAREKALEEAKAKAAADAVPDSPEEDFEDEISDGVQASDTVLDIFGAVAEVGHIKQQLTETFTKFEFQDSVDLLAPYDINFVVTGEDMSVKSQIAIGIAKALNTYHICDKNKLVRAKASELNSRDFAPIFSKLSSGCLIIESAGELDENAVQIIADYIQQENQDVAIVLEGEEKQIMAMFSRFPVLRQRFLNIIHIGKYNENELVQLASGYARKKGYEVSRTAAAVLKDLFRTRMEKGESVNYEDIIVIVEEGISSLEKRNMENLFMTVLDNKYEEAAMFLLQPKDFVPEE